MKTLITLTLSLAFLASPAFAKTWPCTNYVTNYNANLTIHCDRIVAPGGSPKDDHEKIYIK